MSDKIRIAYLIDTIYSGSAGTEKQLLEIIRRLDRERFEITLICLHASPWLARQALPCQVHSLEYRGLLRKDLPAMIGRLRTLIKGQRIDILQAMFEDSVLVATLCRLLARDCPPIFLVSKRDMGLGAEDPWYGVVFRALFPFACRLADGVVVNAERLNSYLRRNPLIPGDRIRVIRNGVALPEAVARRPTPAGDAEVRIGVVANLKPIKRLDILLQALHLLRQGQAFPFQAHLIGDGGQRQELERLANSLGLADCVHFAGSVENVDAWLRRLDIGVLCSDSEGLSNAILEYMAHGLPVVATAVGGNPELVDDGNGRLVPMGDPQALAEALRELGGAPALRRRLGRESANRIRTRFTWEKVMPQWEEYYSSLHAAKAPKGRSLALEKGI